MVFFGESILVESQKLEAKLECLLSIMPGKGNLAEGYNVRFFM